MPCTLVSRSMLSSLALSALYVMTVRCDEGSSFASMPAVEPRPYFRALLLPYMGSLYELLCPELLSPLLP